MDTARPICLYRPPIDTYCIDEVLERLKPNVMIRHEVKNVEDAEYWYSSPPLRLYQI